MFHKIKEYLLGAMLVLFIGSAGFWAGEPHLWIIAHPKYFIPVPYDGNPSEPIDSIYNCMAFVHKLGGGTCAIPVINVPDNAKNQYLNKVFADTGLTLKGH